ncbi:hypothetical protein AVEN_38161-1 [Araneus ventricosus]|uniref:Uncharacterized protein n=1 Tax=Araneus ventricosus TaxID=182803 RepID=A0A4Y2F4Q9_ARAVE|nr:hypothetical protein AVEN_38161-1 [Araneus ventricosus]
MKAILDRAVFVILNRNQMTRPGLASPVRISASHQWEDAWPTCNSSTYTEGLQWNRDSNLESSGSDINTLQIDRGLFQTLDYLKKKQEKGKINAKI